MDAVQTRRWYQLHWLTWLAVILECAAIARCQCIEQGGFFVADATYMKNCYFGWPAVNLERIESGVAWYPRSAPTVEFKLDSSSLAFDCSCWALIVISIGAVVELRMRRPKRLQFSLRGLGLLMLVVAGLLALIKRRSLIADGIANLGMPPAFFSDDLLDNRSDWLVFVALFAGLGCFIGLAVCVVGRMTCGLLALLTLRPSANTETE